MNFTVIFDMNGVIVDDERIQQQSWVEFCKKYVFHITEKEFKEKVFGRREKDTFEYLFRKQMNETEVAKYSDERVAIAIEIFEKDPKLTDGLKELLEKLVENNVAMGVATSSRKYYVGFIMDKFDIGKYFKAIVTAEDVEKGKPDPEIYLKTANLLNVEPESCVVFEDTISGIRSGQAAGMKVIAITTTHQAEELSLAEMIIDSFENISLDKIGSILN